MLALLAQTTISEVILLFVLLFVIPGMAVMLRRLRRLEAGNAEPPSGRKAEPVPEKPAAPDVSKPPPAPPDRFPYRKKALLSPPERSCLKALEEALGGESRVHPKVAAWGLIEPAEADPAFFSRLNGNFFDFLLCEAQSGEPFAAAVFEPEQGLSRKRADELRKVCEAAGVTLFTLPALESYETEAMKKILNLVEL